MAEVKGFLTTVITYTDMVPGRAGMGTPKSIRDPCHPRKTGIYSLSKIDIRE